MKTYQLPAGVIPANDIVSFCEPRIGNVKKILLISGGLVHYVFKIQGPNISAYLKIRANTFSTNNRIIINPDDLKYEKIGLQLYNKHCPGVFPKLWGYDSKRHLLLLEDIFPYGGSTLKKALDRKPIRNEIYRKIGHQLGYVSKQVSWYKELQVNFPAERYEKNLQFRIGFLNRPAADQIITQLANEPKQLICGDLSPKNIAVLPNERIRFFDLDMVHVGNKVFDVGFLAGHIILENLKYGKKATKDALINFIRGYTDFDNDLIFDNPLTVKIAVTSILYRLNNGVIPYNCGIEASSKGKIISNLLTLLDNDIQKWSELLTA